MAIGTPVFVEGGSATGLFTTAAFSTTDILFAHVGGRNASAFPTISISDSLGLTWNAIVTADGPGVNAFIRTRLYWAQGTGASMTVSGVCTGNSAYLGLTRVPMLTPDVTNVGQNASTTGDPAPAITGSPAAAICFALAQNGNSLTQASGYTVLQNAAYFSSQFRGAASFDLSSPALTCSYSSAGSQSVGILLELKELVAANLNRQSMFYQRERRRA